MGVLVSPKARRARARILKLSRDGRADADHSREPSANGSSEEVALVERAMTGDGDAFDALVERRLIPTFRLARAILGTTEEAEDATQEAFIAAWRGLGSLHDPGRFDAWFSRIIVNACRMRLRRRRGIVLVSIESIADGARVSTEDGLGGLVATDELNRAIDGLPIQQRAILALYYLQDRPLADVAAILGIPLGTAKWRLSEARTALRRAIEANDQAPAIRSNGGAALPAAQAETVVALPDARA
jgi:RNA polymerase sigma-70 factor, ECF subfamily